MQSIPLCVSVGTALLLTSSYSRSEPYDRSVFDLLLSVAVSAAAVYLVQRRYPSIFTPTQDRKGRFDTISLQDLDNLPSGLQKGGTTSVADGYGVRKHVVLVQVAIIALAVRIEVYRRISEVAQCSSRSWEVWIPLALAVNECRYRRDVQSQTKTETSGISHYGNGLRLLDSLWKSPWRYFPSAVVLSYGCWSFTALWLSQNSSYICPVVSGEIWSIPRLQQFAAAIDCMMAVLLQEIIRSKTTTSHRLLSVPSSCAVILFGAVAGWIMYAVGLYILRRERMLWIFVNDTPSLLRPLWLTLVRSCICGVFVMSSIYYVVNNSVYHLSVALTASVTMFLGLRNLYAVQYSYPPNTSNTSVLAFLLIYFGVWSSFRIVQSPVQSQALRSSIWQALMFAVLFILVIAKMWETQRIDSHPIDNLMSEAKTWHERYIVYANTSTDLSSAVTIYRERYGSHPPPGFDIWYDFARNRSVLIMDDYDQIHRDLLPFRAVTPAAIRRQTSAAVSNPWNEISRISIRDGRARVPEDVMGTHRWMLEGVEAFINSFAQYLPDMDLAFNLNDESRVAIPNRDLTWLRNTAAQNSLGGKATWSPDRASTWLDAGTGDQDQTVFENWSFQTNFQRFGSVGCPSNSLSKTHPYLNSQSHLCLQCLQPHSVGQFVSNWTLAADMCHQPDMSHLHGFYLSPAAFKTTHRLMPVFSQSKAGGYNDILYPSAWNYRDKVAYAPADAVGELGSEGYKPAYPDPRFTEKDDVLYWRGATSEGVSAGLHTWRGMNRQRLVHLVNNATSNSDHDYTTVLLPKPGKKDSYSYQTVPGSEIVSLGLQQKTDIKIADHIARCGGVDCTDQEQEFGLVNPVEFQSHWQYRYLFDMDGAGFSGRFLPFLQSRSLPFKTALFREWYDSRITAWLHFVPIDMRLHGVWSTLAYFAGVDGVWPGTRKKYTWDAHLAQGEFIAEEGRKWANTVLRKEDMEAYFFRLLLEWGRLTDDRRDELGFVVGE